MAEQQLCCKAECPLLSEGAAHPYHTGVLFQISKWNTKSFLLKITFRAHGTHVPAFEVS